MYESDHVLNHDWTMNNLKESFNIMKAITTRKTTLKMTILCHAIRICEVYVV